MHTHYNISSSSLCHNHKECQLQNYLQLPHGRHHLHGRSPCRQHNIITITLCIYSHTMLHYDHQCKVIFFTKSPVNTKLPTWASFKKWQPDTYPLFSVWYRPGTNISTRLPSQAIKLNKNDRYFLLKVIMFFLSSWACPACRWIVWTTSRSALQTTPWKP